MKLNSNNVILICNVNSKILNVYTRNEHDEENNKDNITKEQIYKNDLLSLYIHIDSAYNISCRDKYTNYRRIFVSLKDPIENIKISSNPQSMSLSPLINFHCSIPFSHSQNFSSFKDKLLIIEVWDEESHIRHHLVGLVKIHLDKLYKYLNKNDYDDIKNSL